MRSVVRQRLLLAAFVPLWLVCFGLSLDAVLRGVAFPPFHADAGSEGEPPRIVAFSAGRSAPATGLRLGDRVLAVQDVDLHGTDAVGLRSAFARFDASAGPLRLTVRRGSDVRQTALEPGSYRRHWPRLLASLAFAASALLLVLRARPSPMERTFVAAFAAASVFFACSFAGPRWVTTVAMTVHGLSLSLAAVLGLRCALLFPHGFAPAGALAAFGPWLFALVGPLDTSRFYAIPFSRELGAWGAGVLAALYFLVVLGSLTHTYRRSDRIGRRQLKWLLLGAYAAAVPPLITAALAAWDPRLSQLLVVSASALGLFPLALVIAITRYNFFDIDGILSATASYSVLVAALIGSALAVAPPAAEHLGDALGVSRSAAGVVVALALVAGIVPVHRALHPGLERILLHERHALETGLAQLLHALSRCATPDELMRCAGERLDTLLRPESIAIYTRAGHEFAPAFVRGMAVPPSFESSGALITTLEKRAGPLCGDAEARGYGDALASPFERAALETLAVPMVVPVRREETLAGFLCLGERMSGDVYASPERSLLATAADKIAGELLRFDQAELLTASRALQENLRRYVPGALAEEIDEGRELEVGEAEVSVLFVDLRGYSGYAEPLGPEQIFSTVNRYTQTVSAIVGEHGGTVVEFNGDGMMAVFGAPRPLEDKERAATEAGRQIVSAVSKLPVDGDRPLSVGVGVATGTAFVGNVRAVDRLIWTALGNPTNLAARLQALSRELAATMVIDEATWTRAGALAQRFTCHAGARIRGRQRPENIYVLPSPVPA